MRTIILGFYILKFNYDSSCEIYRAVGNSFEGYLGYQLGSIKYKKIDEAISYIKESSIYIWLNNDQKYLCEEYNLTRDFVEKFLGYAFPKEIQSNLHDFYKLEEKQISNQIKAKLI